MIDNREEDMSDDNKSDESKIVKMFDAILKDVKNIGSTTKPASVKSRGTNINPHPLEIKLINVAKKRFSKKIIDLTSICNF